MPFGSDDEVQLSYQVNVTGQEQIEALVEQNKALQQQMQEMKTKVDGARVTHEKHTGALLQARRAILDVRKELFIFGFAIGTLTTLMAALARGSNDLASAMQSLGRDAASASKPVGDFLAKAIRALGGKGFTAPDLSIENQVQLSKLLSDIDTLRGNTHAALVEKLRSEEILLADKVGDKWSTTFKRVFDERRRLLLEEHRLAELGLKTQAAIAREFRTGLVGGTRGAASDVLTSVFSGEPVSGEDVLKAFQASFARTMAEAITQSLFTSMASGGGFMSSLKNILTGRTPQVIAAERAAIASEKSAAANDQMIAILQQIAECTCSTARAIGGASVTGPSSGGSAGKIAQVAGLIGAVAGVGALGFGGFGGGGMPPAPTLTIDALPRGHSGGRLGSFASGGEIPFLGMPGEFVVRRSAAQDNREILEEMNAGKRIGGGGGNVFLIRANDAASFAALLSSPAARSQIEVQVIRAVMGNGSVRNVIREFAR